MKATGIVRRIDDLGRVVIPKEIRRTLRIGEGDSLEIFVDRDGEVILKKYSPFSELTNFAREYAEALYDTLGHTVIISDRDSVVAVAGASKKEYLNKNNGEIIETILAERKTRLVTEPGEASFVESVNENYQSYAAGTVIANGDVIGTVVIISNDEKITEIEQKAIDTAINFFARQMEQR